MKFASSNRLMPLLAIRSSKMKMCRLQTLVLICLMIPACGVRPKDRNQTSSSDINVSSAPTVDHERQLEILAIARSKAEEASKILGYSIGETGCDYRAFYLSMALATEGIYSSAFYGMARTGFKFVPKAGITWEYHVAPMIQMNEEAWVVDPTMRALGLSDEIVLSRAQWKDLLSVEKQVFWKAEDGDEGIREFYFQGSFTLLENLRVRQQGDNARAPASAMAAFQKEQEAIKKSSFAAMLPFAMSDINEVCKSIIFLTHQEKDNSIDKQKDLIKNFEGLVAGLEARGKLKRDVAFTCSTRSN